MQQEERSDASVAFRSAKTLLHFLCRDGMRLSVVEFAQEPAFTQTFVNLSVLND